MTCGRQHLPGPLTAALYGGCAGCEVEQKSETIIDLGAEVERLREKNRDFHRRVQEAESRAAKAWRQNDIARLWGTVAHLKWRAEYAHRGEMRWRKLYREAADKIRESGLVVGHPRLGILEGRLDVLVDQLIASARRPIWRRFVVWATESRSEGER